MEREHDEDPAVRGALEDAVEELPDRGNVLERAVGAQGGARDGQGWVARDGKGDGQADGVKLLCAGVCVGDGSMVCWL